MCSPIHFSALDGGHRTWAIVCSLTGVGFDANAKVDLYGTWFNPYKKTINPDCTMLATFDTHLVFNEMTFNEEFFDKEDSDCARAVSTILKENEETLNRTTRLGFLLSYLSELRDSGYCLGSTRKLFFDPFEVTLQSNKRTGSVKIARSLETKLKNLMIAIYNRVTTKEPYRTLLNNPQKPKEIFGKDNKATPFEILLKALNFKFCNQTGNKSKLLQRVKPPLPVMCVVYSLTFCAMFSDVVEEILATLQKRSSHDNLYRLEDFVFESMCLPDFAIGGLFRFLVPYETKFNKAGETIDFGEKNASR